MTERESAVLREMRTVIRPWLDESVRALPQGAQLPDVIRDHVLSEVRATSGDSEAMNAGRLPSLFAATKFVVAGAIVALFANLLLAGVMMQQGEETAPIVGASASAEVRDDIVRGVELEVEEVGPRLARVLGDGERQTRRNVRDVAVAPDGDVWVMRQNGTVYRLGEPGNAFQQREARFLHRSDGTLWVGDRILQGADWFTDEDAFCALTSIWEHLAPDGTCWSSRGGSHGIYLFQHDPTGQKLQGLAPDDRPGGGHRFAMAQDGTIWTMPASDVAFAGLASYDGKTWTAIEYDGVNERWGTLDLAVGPDGTVWVTSRRVPRYPGAGLTVVSWDGEAWSTYGPLELPGGHRGSHPGSPLGIDFLPDGSPWFQGGAELDGDTLRPIQVLEPNGDRTPAIMALANGPDGTTWVVVDQPGNKRGGLYVITPEAMAPME